MAMDDQGFERELKRQAPRPVPAEWRREILEAVREATDERRGPERFEVGGWWRQWLVFRRLAWGGLAAAWVLILGLNWAANRPGGEGAVEAVFSPAVVALAFQQSQQIAAGLEPAETKQGRAPGAERPRSAVTVELRAV
jgi:hypothetical protein